MDEGLAIIAGMTVLIVAMVGTIGVISFKSEQQVLECIQKVHDKPAIEINAICKK